MVPDVKIVGERIAEMKIEHACPSCGGTLQLRLSPDGSRGVCLPCQLIVTAVVRPGHGGLQVNFPTVGQA